MVFSHFLNSFFFLLTVSSRLTQLQYLLHNQKQFFNVSSPFIAFCLLPYAKPEIALLFDSLLSFLLIFDRYSLDVLVQCIRSYSIFLLQFKNISHSFGFHSHSYSWKWSCWSNKKENQSVFFLQSNFIYRILFLILHNTFGK